MLMLIERQFCDKHQNILPKSAACEGKVARSLIQPIASHLVSLRTLPSQLLLFLLSCAYDLGIYHGGATLMTT
jgi:hypothetical protein